MRRLFVSGVALLAGLVMATGWPIERVAQAEYGDVIICNEYRYCMVLPPTSTCDPTPFSPIWGVHNSSLATVEFYSGGYCDAPMAAVYPGSGCAGPIAAYRYRMS